jgi:bifunctional DNase/RNase
VQRDIDARPSDAIALAIRAGCRIFATRDVLKRRTAVHLDAWLSKLDANNIEPQQA